MELLQKVYKGKTDWWRWLLIVVIFFTPTLSVFIRNEIIKPLLSVLPESRNIYFAVVQLRYIILFVLFLFLFKLLHKRGVKTLITRRKNIDWIRFWLSFSVWGMILMLLFSVAFVLNPDVYKWNLKLIPFLKLFILSSVLLPFRILFVVLLMFSYNLQMINLLLKKPWVSILVSTFIFTILMHINSKELLDSMGGLVILSYVLLGLLLASIIVLDDGIEIAFGMLLVTTLISRLFITYTTFNFQANAVLIKEGNPDLNIRLLIIPLVCYPLFFLVLKKIYHWKDWKEKLFKKTENPIV